MARAQSSEYSKHVNKFRKTQVIVIFHLKECVKDNVYFLLNITNSVLKSVEPISILGFIVF
jgi:hypothetical protein